MLSHRQRVVLPYPFSVPIQSNQKAKNFSQCQSLTFNNSYTKNHLPVKNSPKFTKLVACGISKVLGVIVKRPRYFLEGGVQFCTGSPSRSSSAHFPGLSSAIKKGGSDSEVSWEKLSSTFFLQSIGKCDEEHEGKQERE